MATSIPQQPAIQPPPTAEELAALQAAKRKQKIIIAVVVTVLVVILVLLIWAIIVLFHPTTPTDRIRDIFIILVALESFVIGAALIVLIVQLASLINLIQNEIRPILYATTETLNTLRGTAEFLGENVVEPVIKLNSYLAGLRRMLQLLGIKPK
jgi:hypothetical protein